MFPGTPEGWALAWKEFRSGDPTAAELYRRDERMRREAHAKAEARYAVLKSAEARTPPRRVDPDDLAAYAFVIVPGCRLVSGYGNPTSTGEGEATLYFLLDRLEVVQSNSSESLLTVGLDEVLNLQVDGPGAQTSGGGFIGGGLGLEGAAEGMIMAAALNAITRRTTVQTFIEVHVLGRHLLWVTDKTTPAQLLLLLKPIYARMRELALAKETVAVDPLDRLSKVGALRDAGVLTEAEFDAAKALLLADLSERTM
jgi:hypothetical protein